MRPGKTTNNYIDPLFGRRDANAQFLPELYDRGNVDKTDCFKLLEDLRQLSESTVFRLQEVHEKLSSTSIRVHSVPNGCFIHVEQLEVRIHSETIYVSNSHELFDTLHLADRLLNRASYKGRF